MGRHGGIQMKNFPSKGNTRGRCGRYGGGTGEHGAFHCFLARIPRVWLDISIDLSGAYHRCQAPEI